MTTASVESAQTRTGKVTARQLLNVLKQGSRTCYLHGEALPGREFYSGAYVFTVTAVAEKNGTEIETRVEVPGHVGNGNTSEKHIRQKGRLDEWHTFDGVYRPLKGYWSLFAHQTQLMSLLRVLPKDAEVSFAVKLDYGTHEYLVRSDAKMNRETFEGLHADHLYLEARYMSRGEVVRAEFLIDVSVTPHNTARFGAPGSVLG